MIITISASSAIVHGAAVNIVAFDLLRDMGVSGSSPEV